MGHRLSPEQAELYRRVDEVLHYLWDPIGVARIPEARDEYQSYLPHVFSLLINKASAAEIVAFLLKTECDTTGLNRTPDAQQRVEEITSILRLSRDMILKRGDFEKSG
jgi:hypothetical protein